MQVLADVVRALKEQHEAGWLHCDLKADNIIIKKNYNGSFSGRIIDFGLAKKTSDMPFPLHSYKPEEYEKNRFDYGHIPPEMLLCKTGETYESEVYALGFMLSWVAASYDVSWLSVLAELCQEEDPVMRPTLENILEIINEEVCLLSINQCLNSI